MRLAEVIEAFSGGIARGVRIAIEWLYSKPEVVRSITSERVRVCWPLCSSRPGGFSTPSPAEMKQATALLLSN